MNRGEEYVPLLSLRRDSPPKSSPTFFVRPRSSVGRVTVDLIRRSWVRFPPRSKDFSLPRVFPWFPLLGLTPSGLFMGSISTLIYTSELTLCFTICVHSATWHNIYNYVYMLARSRRWGSIGKYAFNIGEVWNLVCCHGNELLSLFRRILQQRII